MTTSTQRFLPTPAGAPNRSRDPFPQAKVIGEIKPHTSSGISAGVAQLRRRLLAVSPAQRIAIRPQLVTYRASARDGYYEVLAPDSTLLKQWALTGVKPAGIPWYSLGEFYFAEALQTIQRRDCPSLLGGLIERRVRSHYAARIGIPPLALKSSAAHGPDFQHELAEFLHELATELELEARYGS
ncbi:hypothetical protein [Nocardioides jiangxiensis]|uniref:Uncharacterized protein n=1 Tax=Nocardioides jiangxiensis TaxID=3064524 RepID=A0ABT9AX21_9ACTN|nr:hypothetical protein [Nocardioides sp. WY-20]MDO7866768.1 hypothetical protein [Nocardioides sp. WY-20]